MIFSDKMTDKIGPASCLLILVLHRFHICCRLLLPPFLHRPNSSLGTTSIPELLNLHSLTSNIGGTSSSLPESTPVHSTAIAKEKGRSDANSS